MKLEEWVRLRQMELALGLAGLILVGVGLWWWRVQEIDEVKVEVLSAGTETSNPSGLVVVDVAGAVNRPGVYRLSAGARVDEAIAAAGGLTKDADVEWVEKYLNRSEKAGDGRKIYVPRRQVKAAAGRGSSRSESGEEEVKQKLNINTASGRELEALPGIGPVTAGRIESGRPYGRIEELVERKIVGRRVWEQIKDKISVW